MHSQEFACTANNAVHAVFGGRLCGATLILLASFFRTASTLSLSTAFVTSCSLAVEFCTFVY